MSKSPKQAVFLDRDGVLIRDVHLLTRPAQLELHDGAAAALCALRQVGFRLVLVSNQPVVARGLCSEADVNAVHDALAAMIRAQGGPPFDAVRFCPHHPRADVARYRVECACRKPRPGMLIDAAAALSVDLARSWMIGDRISDIEAGRRAGCRTLQVLTGAHRDAPIESADPIAPDTNPDFTAPDLPAAVEYILACDAGL